MKKSFKEKMIIFLDDSATRGYIALLFGFLVYFIVGLFTNIFVLKLLLYYLAYFVFLRFLKKYVDKNKKNEK